MSALHQAVARAIASAYADRWGPARPYGDQGDTIRHEATAQEKAERAAAAAVGVVLAEAKHQVEALRDDMDIGHDVADTAWDEALNVALAVLAALGEQA